MVENEPLCDDGFITELDVNKQPPWVTYSYGCHSCGVQDNTSSYRYFITPISNRRGRSVHRTVGGNIGKWKKIYEEIINRGRKIRLIYDDRNNGKWIMKKYVLSEILLRKLNKSDEYRDYVICAVKKIDSAQQPKVDDQQVYFSQELSIEFIDIMLMEFDAQLIDTSAGDTVREQHSMVADLVEAMSELEVDK
ncbi:hypothetical protein H5410_033195 [Solanum commersonii]|uniref:NAC domain-containing protein n=1 Tax=Solanum commersonii TaxID=4109 RepID=A0A9J5YN30_SOLCO|nr:hypothetical protein H5410_033195 [Solanum commersonii]